MSFKIKTHNFLQQHLLILLLPIFPLLDFYLFKSFPYITAAVYLIVLLKYARVRCFDATIVLFSGITILSLLVTGLLKGFTLDQLKYFLCYVTFLSLGLYVGNNIDKTLQVLIKFAYSYFTINTLIFIYRLVAFNFDFNRVRNGTGVFGGNSAQFVFLMVLLFLKNYDEYKKHYYAMLIITILNAVLYVSKGAIIVTLVWIVFDVLNQRKTKAINWKVIIFVLIGVVFFRFFLMDKISGLLDFTLERFTIWNNLYQSTGGLLGTRGKIFEFCLEYLKDKPTILLFGNGPTFFREINPWHYSNSHNLFMDILFDTGVFGLISFLIIFLKTLIKSDNKIFYLLCIGYATIEGVALFYIDGSGPIMTGFAFFLIIAYYYSNKSKIVDSNSNVLQKTKEIQKGKII